MEQYNLNAETAIILVVGFYISILFSFLKHFLILFQNEPILLDHFTSISRSLTELPKKVIYNFLINDLLTYCNKLNLDVEDW